MNCEGWGGGRVSHARDVEGEAFGEEGLLVDGPEFLGQERVFGAAWGGVFCDKVELNILLAGDGGASCRGSGGGVAEAGCVVAGSHGDRDQWQLYHKTNSVMFNLCDVDAKNFVLVRRMRPQRHRP